MNKFDTEIQAIATRSFVQDRVPNFEEKLFGVDLTGWKVYNAYISLLNDDTTKNDDDTAYLASFMKKMKESGFALNVIYEVFEILLYKQCYDTVMTRLNALGIRNFSTNFIDSVFRRKNLLDSAHILFEVVFMDDTRYVQNISIEYAGDFLYMITEQDFWNFTQGRSIRYIETSTL